jgi:hypothetical protein
MLPKKQKTKDKKKRRQTTFNQNTQRNLKMATMVMHHP